MMDGPSSQAGTADIAALHRALVDELKERGYIVTPAVEEAFRAVPRHLFLPGVPPERVYRDDAIPTRFEGGQAISSSSQPAIMAVMLEQLDLRPGQRVLEIGAGTGYNAALMAHIAGEAGEVVTVDIDEDIVAAAREHLGAAGFARVRVVCADGGFGYPERAPYDRIILTVGAWDITPAWREQLAPGGRLVLPLSVRGPQVAVAFERADGYLESVSVKPCGFMPLRGVMASPRTVLPLGRDRGPGLEMEEPERVDADALAAALAGPSNDRTIGVAARPGELVSGLPLWLALREPGFGGLAWGDAPVDGGLAPIHRWSGGGSSTFGLAAGASLAVLMRPADQPAPVACPDDAPPFPLWVRAFGPDEALSRRLMEQVRAWDAAGRPSPERLRISAYPRESPYSPSPGEIVVEKRWTRLVLDWS